MPVELKRGLLETIQFHANLAFGILCCRLSYLDEKTTRV